MNSEREITHLPDVTADTLLQAVATLPDFEWQFWIGADNRKAPSRVASCVGNQRK